MYHQLHLFCVSLAQSYLETDPYIDYYFSIDRGETKIASFARGVFGEGADGFQTSHWAATEDFPLGIMAPSLSLGQSIEISSVQDKSLNHRQERGLMS